MQNACQWVTGCQEHSLDRFLQRLQDRLEQRHVTSNFSIFHQCCVCYHLAQTFREKRKQSDCVSTEQVRGRTEAQRSEAVPYFLSTHLCYLWEGGQRTATVRDPGDGREGECVSMHECICVREGEKWGETGRVLKKSTCDFGNEKSRKYRLSDDRKCLIAPGPQKTQNWPMPGLWVMSYEFWVLSYEFWVMSYELWVMSYELCLFQK